MCTKHIGADHREGQQNAVAAAIAAAATYYAGRLSPPSRIFAQPNAVRAGRGVLLRHALVLHGGLLAAYVTGLVPLLVVTAMDAPSGGPDVLVMLTGLLGISAAIAIGYVIGVVGRTAFLAPLSFVLVLATTPVGTSGDTFAALVPVLHMSPMLGQTEAFPFVLYRIAFFVAVITVELGGRSDPLLPGPRQHRCGPRQDHAQDRQAGQDDGQRPERPGEPHAVPSHGRLPTR